LNGYVFILSTQYYTDYEYQPVRDIAQASLTGHGTNIITGVAVGMKSTVVPVITISWAVLITYHLGASSGVGTARSAGLFGTAVATMGMLSSAVYILSMNNFGPIAENAGGISEMSHQPEEIRPSRRRR
jgi:inorganic pyrophosphatase